MGNLKYGKNPARKLFGVAEMEAYHSGRLPAPPATLMYANTIPQTGWGMMDNDRLGCCTISGVGHLIMAYNAETGKSDHVPTDPEVSDTYFSLTGGADSGLVEADVMQKWATDGLFGSKILAYNQLQTNLLALHTGIYSYGALYLGIEVPESMQTDFADGTPIVYHPGSPIEGGHCVIAVGYDQHYLDIVTWGKRVRMSYPFLAHYLTEAWVTIPDAFAAEGHGPIPSIDVNTLRQDLGIA